MILKGSNSTPLSYWKIMIGELMIKECPVKLNNDVVTVIKYGDIDVQLPSIHKDLKKVFVKYENGKYSIVNGNSKSVSAKKSSKKSTIKKTTIKESAINKESIIEEGSANDGN